MQAPQCSHRALARHHRSYHFDKLRADKPIRRYADTQSRRHHKLETSFLSGFSRAKERAATGRIDCADQLEVPLKVKMRSPRRNHTQSSHAFINHVAKRSPNWSHRSGTRVFQPLPLSAWGFACLISARLFPPCLISPCLISPRLFSACLFPD